MAIIYFFGKSQMAGRVNFPPLLPCPGCGQLAFGLDHNLCDDCNYLEEVLTSQQLMTPISPKSPTCISQPVYVPAVRRTTRDDLQEMLRNMEEDFCTMCGVTLSNGEGIDCAKCVGIHMKRWLSFLTECPQCGELKAKDEINEHEVCLECSRGNDGLCLQCGGPFEEDVFGEDTCRSCDLLI